jgi:hypothetical protein
MTTTNLENSRRKKSKPAQRPLLGHTHQDKV